MWVELVSRDEACFHCNAALSVVAFDPYFDDKENAIVALRYWTFALRLLNERLSGKDACSDFTIANIVSMTHYDRLRGAYEQGLMHFDGLRKMVDVRGGISEFTKVWPRMAQKVFRSDLEFSLHLGSRTRYHLNDVRASHNHSWVRTSFMKAKKDGFCQIYAAEASSVDLQDAFIEFMSLSWLLNNQEENRGVTDAYMLHEIIIQLIHLLLDIRPLGDTRPTNFVDDALYAGLLLFVVTFLIDLGRKVPEYALLYKLAQISAKIPSYEYQDHKELYFWMLLIGRSSVFRDHDDQWLAPKVSDAANSLNIQTWEDAKRILSEFPWFSPFHNKQGQRLWEKSILLHTSSGSK